MKVCFPFNDFGQKKLAVFFLEKISMLLAMRQLTKLDQNLPSGPSS
jgi:hypothetical protein